MVLVDSCVRTEYFNGDANPHTDFPDGMPGVEPVGFGDIMLTEVHQGFRSDRAYRTAKSLLPSLSVFELPGAAGAIRAA